MLAVTGPFSREYPTLTMTHWVYTFRSISWWRHQMETFSALLAICAGNSPVPGEFPAQRPVTRSFDVLFDLRLNKRLSKQTWGWWFETLSRPLWRNCNVIQSRYQINLSTIPWVLVQRWSWPKPQALHRPSHTRHSHHAGSGVGCVMSTLEGTKRSSGPAGNFARNGRRTA